MVSTLYNLKMCHTIRPRRRTNPCGKKALEVPSEPKPSSPRTYTCVRSPHCSSHRPQRSHVFYLRPVTYTLAQSVWSKQETRRGGEGWRRGRERGKKGGGEEGKGGRRGRVCYARGADSSTWVPSNESYFKSGSVG